jgi:hypothetical protein
MRALWPLQGSALSRNQEIQNNDPPVADNTAAADEPTVQQDRPQTSDSGMDSETTAADASDNSSADHPPAVAEQATVAEDSQIAALGPAFTPTGSVTPTESTATPLKTAFIPTDKEPPDQINAAVGKEPYAPILGIVSLKRDETISLVIQTVYGTFNSKYFRSLILANPDIDDPDWVDVDQEVSLPAIPVTVETTDRNISWILVDEKDDLNSAFDFLRNYPANAPPARLIPYWNQQSGTRFAIILKEYFFDVDTALEQLSRLPAELAPTGKVLSSWGQDTVFFANPYTRSSSASSFQAQGE